jgi:hypothetical protein
MTIQSRVSDPERGLTGAWHGGRVSFDALPATAAWQHLDARSGFEVVYFRGLGDGYWIDGRTAAIESGQTWIVDYEISVDSRWATRAATVRGLSTSGTRSTVLRATGEGQWTVDGEAAPHLDGCLDVDLEASAFTNALPVRRLRLAHGESSRAPAAYVRALDVSVERLEQTYVRAADDCRRQRFEYSAPAFGFVCELVYDESGLLLDYPGIAVRAG